MGERKAMGVLAPQVVGVKEEAFVMTSEGSVLSQRALNVVKYVGDLTLNDRTKVQEARDRIGGLLTVAESKLRSEAHQPITNIQGLLGYKGRNAEVREMADDFRDAITVGSIVGIRRGGKGSDVEKAIRNKNGAQVDSLYGGGVVVGIGKALVESMVTDAVLATNLATLKEQLFKGIPGAVETAMQKIMPLYVGGRVDRRQAEMVLAYLNALVVSGQARSQVPGGVGGDPVLRVLQQIDKAMQIQAASTLKSDAYFEQQLEVRNLQESQTLDKWIEGVRDITPGNRSGGMMWELNPPDWIDKITQNEWMDLLVTVDFFTGSVAARRNDGDFKTSIDIMKGKIIEMGKVPEKYIKWLYERRGFGFREALQYVVRDLFVERSFERVKADGARETTKIWEFKEPDKEKNLFLQDAAEWKKQFGINLYRWGAVKSEEQGMIMASMAVDFLELGGQLELADTRRALGYTSDALRTTQRPENKFGPRIGQEFWAGPWGEYLLEVSGFDKDYARKMADRLKIVPKLLAGSVLNNKVEIRGGEKVFLGDALMQGWDVNFEEREGDIYFPWKKEQVLPAADLWSYISGSKNTRLEFGKLQEVNDVISRWRGGLFNAIKDLRGEKNPVSVVPVELVAAAIGGSTGLYPFEPPRLQVTNIDDPSTDPYFRNTYIDVCLAIIRKMGLRPGEEDYLRKFFGINNEDAEKLRKDLADYDFVTNPTVAKWLRRQRYKAHDWKFRLP